MRALILAAGRGTRLRPLTDTCPKPMLELAGRPILERIVVALRDGAGVREFIIITGHLAEIIEGHFGSGERLGVSVRCLRQERQDGTGSAVHLARDLLSDAPFVLTWGDIVVAEENYGGIVGAHRRHPCDAMLGLNWVDDPAAGAAIYLGEQSRVTRIVEKPRPGESTTHWNNAGLMVLRPGVFDHTARLQLSGRGEHELPDAIHAWMRAGADVRGYPLAGFWSDVGTLEDLQRTREAFAK